MRANGFCPKIVWSTTSKRVWCSIYILVTGFNNQIWIYESGIFTNFLANDNIFDEKHNKSHVPVNKRDSLYLVNKIIKSWIPIFWNWLLDPVNKIKLVFSFSQIFWPCLTIFCLLVVMFINLIGYKIRENSEFVVL